MAVATTSLLAGAMIASAVATTAASVTSTIQQRKAMKSMKSAPAYNAKKEKNRIANQEAEANRIRALGETDTTKTSALGNTGETQLKKKTVLGG